MKYSLIFAATAAAYDAYGKDGYGDKPTPAKESCLATITPGYGKEPVTITKQHQPYPTCVQKGYGDKSCDKWGEDTYVSTTIKDYNGKDCVITKTNDRVTVYYEKKTITHTETGKYGAKPTPADNKYPAPTGGYSSKENTDDKGCWYELYEKVETAEYGKLGAHALKGYPGSGLCKDSDKEQEVYCKEYKDGKWGNEYQTKHSYGKPEPEVTSYEKPGVYTIPGKDKTVDSTMYYGAEATKTAKAGETCTYGGQYIEAKQTGYVKAGYADYETKVYDGKTSTSTVIKYTTIHVTSTGKVEVCKPTTTVYDKDTTVTYPTASYYNPGVYHQEPKVVTVTKSGESYTCDYQPTPIKGHGNNWGYDSYPTATPKKDEGYKAEPTPYKPGKPTEGDKKDYPSYPVPGNNTNVYYSKPSGEYPAPTPVYGDKPYGDKPYDGKTNKDGKDYPAPPASTPCDDDKKGYPTGVPNKPYADKPNKPEGDKPVYGDKPNKPEGDKPVYGDKPSTPSNDKPVYGDKPYTPSNDKPVYGDKPSVPQNGYPTPTPVYGDKPYDGKTNKDGKDYPAPPASTPCDDDKKGYPTPTPVKGAGYGKRDSMMARRARAL